MGGSLQTITRFVEFANFVVATESGIKTSCVAP